VPAQTGLTVRVVVNRLPAAETALHTAVVEQVKRSTYDVEARAKELAPVRTGTLRRSIHSIFEDGGLRGIVGPSVDYGAPVELGTRHMAARPYMRPSAALVLPRFADEIKAVLRRIG
jgi:HK97 gp10 family phage protein